MRHTSSFPKVSNRERQRLAQHALRQTMDMRMILLAVLAQQGGEVVVKEDTIARVSEALHRPLTALMDFEVRVNPVNEKERIVRIVS